MKTCNRCGKKKNIEDFYKCITMAGGYLNKCKECSKAQIKKWREENREHVSEYESRRGKRPDRRAYNNAYQKTEAGKIARKRRKEKYIARYPFKYVAKVLLKNAVKAGKIKRETVCSKCGSSFKIEGHHSDYSKPLDIIWFCCYCHNEWHRNNEAIYPF